MSLDQCVWSTSYQRPNPAAHRLHAQTDMTKRMLSSMADPRKWSLGVHFNHTYDMADTDIRVYCSTSL